MQGQAVLNESQIDNRLPEERMLPQMINKLNQLPYLLLPPLPMIIPQSQVLLPDILTRGTLSISYPIHRLNLSTHLIFLEKYINFTRMFPYPIQYTISCTAIVNSKVAYQPKIDISTHPIIVPLQSLTFILSYNQ